MPQKSSTSRIDAKPTKEFFVEQLTRDIGLVPAIVDLADNSTDGARKLKGDGSFLGLHVNIRATKDKFLIEDNCGGIPVEVARQYAFRFGRPTNMEHTPGEVGRFGVGMKRALFKLGDHFKVTSTSKMSRFVMSQRVSAWLRREDDWHFDFDKPPETGRSFDNDELGTIIEVNDLHESVSQAFGTVQTIETLRAEIRARLQESIGNGLAVVVNDVAQTAHVHQLISDRKLAPAYKALRLRGESGGQVRVRLWCGVTKTEEGKGKPDEAGWYVFCNGRLLLEADQTDATVWGQPGNKKFPEFHGQYVPFRGFAYFDAKEAGDLPMNTTKTGVDPESPVYRAARLEMVAMTREVIDFLNALKRERDAQKDADSTKRGPLSTLFENAAIASLADITSRKQFTMPKVRAPRWASHMAGTKAISYRVPLDRFEAVSDVLEVSKPSEVGKKTFEDFYRRECSDV